MTYEEAYCTVRRYEVVWLQAYCTYSRYVLVTGRLYQQSLFFVTGILYRQSLFFVTGLLYRQSLCFGYRPTLTTISLRWLQILLQILRLSLQADYAYCDLSVAFICFFKQILRYCFK